MGSTTLLPATGGSATLPGGTLALPSNSGHFVHDEFAFVPEVGLQVGFDWTDHVRLSVGYNFLWWSSVVRPGDQVVPIVSARQIPTSLSFAPGGPAVPRPAHNRTDYWVQGLTFGVTIRY